VKGGGCILYLESSAALDVLRDVLRLQSADDVGRLSELFSLVPDVLQLPQQLRQLDPQLRVVLLQLTTSHRIARGRRAAAVSVGRLTAQQRLTLLPMTLRLQHIAENTNRKSMP